MVFGFFVNTSLLHLAVDFNTSVWTHQGATLASYALVGLSHVGIVITTIVHFFALQSEHIARASDNTQVAAFAPDGVHCYCSSNFCHVSSFKFIDNYKGLF